MSKTRFLLPKENSAAYQKIAELDQIGKTGSISESLQELIKIYASQLNGCVFCIDMHSKDALAKGETVQRVIGLAAWEEAAFYTAEERAILAFTKEITLIHQGGVSDKTYQELQQYYNEKEIGELLVLIGTINLYNRIGITTLLQPKID
ncbi:carboxymuconolactone decarboxylase family protein [Enterococcus rotai]|uniref:carboxymuconolactone decarboxylase family protein n=1 Tax=Enterococcus rotai TaxID=118060 RepID=UPI0032B4271F